MGLLERYRRSVALKVLIPQVLVIVLSLIIVVNVAIVGIDGLRKQTIDNEVKSIQSRMSTFIKMRENLILVGTASLSKDNLIKEAIMAGNQEEVQR